MSTSGESSLQRGDSGLPWLLAGSYELGRLDTGTGWFERLPAELTIGPYVLREDAGRLLVRLPRKAGATGEWAAVLSFHLAEQAKGEAPFAVRRLTAGASDTAEIHGYTPDLVSLDIQVSYRRETGGIEFHVKVMNSAEDMAMRLIARLELPGEADPEWMIPGLFYNENRVRDCQRIYPAWSEIHRDPDKFLSNHWSFRADRAAMPVIFCQTHNLLAYLAGQEYSGLSDDGLTGNGIASLGISNEEGVPVLTYQVPYVEEPVKYSYCREDRTRAEATFLTLEKNVAFSTTFEIGLQPPGEEQREKIYRALYLGLWMANPLRPKLSSAEVERLAIDGLLRWHVDEKTSMIYETAAFDKHFGRRGTNAERLHMHVSWLSGVFPAYVLLWHGRDTTNPNYVRVAHQVIDRITQELAPCGTIYPVFTVEDGPMAGFGPDQGLAHARTVAEAVLFLVRAHRLELQANTTHLQWYNAFMSTMDFLLKRQREDGALPAYWYLDDGEVFSYEGAAGMCWIAPLVACSHMIASTAFLEAAVKAGEYYAQFLENGLVYGCVEDLPLVPTCEDCHLALIAYLLLYEADRSPRWLELAKRAADLALTWRFGYNVTFSPCSVLGQSGFQTRGGDISSVATPMLGAYGLLSYGEMRKLAAMTGDGYYEQRALEARTFATQLLVRTDGEFNARRGMAVGQIFHTDWWQPKGMILSMSLAWTGALIEHAELLERHLAIPTAALEGDARSVAEAAARNSVVTMEKEIVLPDPVEIRRQREAELRRVREGRETPLPPRTGIQRIQQIQPVPLARRDAEPRPRVEVAQAGAYSSRASATRPATSTHESENETAARIDVPRRSFARQPTPVPPDEKFFPEGFPLQEAAEDLVDVPRPAKSKTPFAQRHTPLPVEEPLEIDWNDEAHRALMPPGDVHAAELPPLPEPPPAERSDLLANLMSDTTGETRFTPLSETRRQSISEALEEIAVDEEGAEDKRTDEIEIKWKLF